MLNPTRARRRLARTLGDPHALLVATLGVGAILLDLAGGGGEVLPLLAATALATGLVAALPRRASRHPLAHLRFVVAIGLVAFANQVIGDPSFRPAAAFFIPIVAMATAVSSTYGWIIGGLALASLLGPVLADPTHLSQSAQRGLGLGLATLLISFGTHRTVSSLRAYGARLRSSMGRLRRRSIQAAAIEELGRALAASGPTAATLDAVMILLQDRLSYTFVSIYLVDGAGLRLGAQRGYAEPIDWFDGSTGVIGRVRRTLQPQLVTDVTADPDYRSADPTIGSEISVPLLDRGVLLGILNVEAGPGELDRSDLETVLIVADRIASALALAAERSSLAARADVFRRLTAFSAAVNGSLDPEAVYARIVTGAQAVVQADIAALCVLDRSTGVYAVRAGTFADSEQYRGAVIRPGEGVAGRAIRDRAIVVDAEYDRARFPVAVRAAGNLDEVSAVGIPLIRDDVVVGAITLIRNGFGHGLSELEAEVLPLVADHAALAIANTFLYADVAETSITDPLTGLRNRRYLDETLDSVDRERARLAPDDRPVLSAILFDLDHFGTLNKLHGHRTGDEVLRGFAETLKARFRGEDLAARYGGEEFLVLLPGVVREDALRIADDVRRRFGRMRFAGDGSRPISATVSAGVASIGLDGGSVDGLLQLADVSLAFAKRGGRNQVV